jgi:hypothetical protein
MSAINYVKHPKFSPTELDGKSLAWCEQGSVIQCRLHTGDPGPDGRYTLMAGWAAIYAPNANDVGTSVFREPLLDQATVEKIVSAESAGVPELKGFDFAIVHDRPATPSIGARL